MRFFEISSGFRVPVDQEEQSILDKAGEDLFDSTLDEREQEVARKMVSRGLLTRHKGKKGTFYRANNAADLWRF